MYIYCVELSDGNNIDIRQKHGLLAEEAIKVADETAELYNEAFERGKKRRKPPVHALYIFQRFRPGRPEW